MSRFVTEPCATVGMIIPPLFRRLFIAAESRSARLQSFWTLGSCWGSEFCGLDAQGFWAARELEVFSVRS